MLKEFKAFLLKGSVTDLAIGIIIGTSFGKIVSSLVNDIIMPPVGLLVGGIDFSKLFINLSSTAYNSLDEAKAAGAPTLNYGLFLNQVLDFLIVGICIFLLMKLIAKFKYSTDAVTSEPICVYCYMPVNPQATRCPHCTSQLQGRAIGL